MTYVEPSLDLPYVPTEVTDIEIAFPAHALRLMPKREDIPEVDENWHVLANDLFMAQAEDVQLLPSAFLIENDCKPELAWRHLRCILGSYEPKHEHKIEAVAYLMSHWFRWASWLRAGTQSKTTRQRYAGSSELPEGYDEDGRKIEED